MTRIGFARGRDGLSGVALIALAALAGLNLAHGALSVMPLWKQDADFVAASEERLNALPAALPTSGQIGYLSDEYPGDANIVPNAVRKYYLMQYALVPLVVIPTSERDVIVGDFDSFDNAAIPPGIFPARDFGRGVLLLKRKAQ